MRFRHLSRFGALGRVISTVKGFPSSGKGDPVTLQIQGRGEGFILQSEDSPVPWIGAYNPSSPAQDVPLWDPEHGTRLIWYQGCFNVLGP